MSPGLQVPNAEPFSWTLAAQLLYAKQDTTVFPALLSVCCALYTRALRVRRWMVDPKDLASQSLSPIVFCFIFRQFLYVVLGVLGLTV